MTSLTAEAKKYPSIAQALRTRRSSMSVEHLLQISDKLKADKLHPDKKVAKAALLATMQIEDGEQRIRGMKKGDPNREPIPWPLLQVDMFPWSNMDDGLVAHTGCGPAMLAQITHTNPFEVRALLLPIVRKLYPDDMIGKTLYGTHPHLMRQFLNMFGIYMFEVTDHDLRPKGKGFSTPVTNKHVMLTASRLSSQDLTWIAYYAGMKYHNVERKEASYLDIWNETHDSHYLLFCPDWRFKMNGHLEWSLTDAAVEE